MPSATLTSGQPGTHGASRTGALTGTLADKRGRSLEARALVSMPIIRLDNSVRIGQVPRDRKTGVDDGIEEGLPASARQFRNSPLVSDLLKRVVDGHRETGDAHARRCAAWPVPCR